MESVTLKNSPTVDYVTNLISDHVAGWQSTRGTPDKLLIKTQLLKVVDSVFRSLVHHPVLAIIVLTTIMTCGIPLFLLMIFAVVTAMLTFTGFVIIEGTILTLGAMVLFGIILAMLFVIVAVICTASVAYFGFIEMYGLLKTYPKNSPLAGFLLKIPMSRNDRSLDQIDMHIGDDETGGLNICDPMQDENGDEFSKENHQKSSSE